MGTPDVELAEAIVTTCDAILATAGTPLSEALKHPRHSQHILPQRAKAKAIMAKFFKRQSKALIAAVRPRIADVLTEAAAPVFQRPGGQQAAYKILPDTLQPLLFGVSESEDSDWNEAITAAITAAGIEVAKELKTDATLSPSVSSDYLRQNSLSKLTGGLNDTTKQQLRDAVAEAYESGETATGIINAIRATMADFSEFRAEMIAQTEVNDAYNYGRVELATGAAFEEKSWDPDGTACEQCMEQVDAGWIDINDDFPGGVDAPTLHPNCDCGIDFRKGAFEDIAV